MTKKEILYHRLKELRAFWNYDDAPNMPDAVLIEAALRWGDVEEIQMTFDLFSADNIKKVWIEQMLPDERIYPHNFYLAAIFFDIEDPESFILPHQIKYSRYERLRQLTS